MNDTSPSQSVWDEFLHALNAPASEDFNAFYWIYRLTSYALGSIILPCPCSSYERRQKLNSLIGCFRPVVSADNVSNGY
eukprot:scaffold67328_cov41-Cyclotella_meneghiniana.AAC.3